MPWFKGFIILTLLIILTACKAEAAPLFDERSEGPTMKEGVIYVDIKGEIRNPGVYKLRAGSRLLHLVEHAGGFTVAADTKKLTLSMELIDGTIYKIPSIKTEATPGERDANAPADEYEEKDTEEGLIPINTASADLLVTLPSIGPATAEAIVEHRNTSGPFKTLEAIMDVKGIGQKTFETLEPLITLQS